MSLYRGFWGRSGAIFREPEALDMQMDDHLAGANQQGYAWVALDIAYGNWLEVRYQCRSLELEVVAYRDITTIMDLALLTETRRRWPECHYILPRIVSPHTRDRDLMTALYRAARIHGPVGIVTDGPVDQFGEWPIRKRSAGIGMFEADPELDLWQTFGKANAIFQISLPVLPADRGMTRSDFDWRRDRPHVVGNADKVTDWSEWRCR